MQCIEFIRLRTTQPQVERVLAELPAIADEFSSKQDVETCVVVRHARYQGDLGIMLVHTGESTASRTGEASELAEHLSSYGLVDHQVWRTVHSPGTTDRAPGRGKLTSMTEPSEYSRKESELN